MSHKSCLHFIVILRVENINKHQLRLFLWVSGILKASRYLKLNVSTKVLFSLILSGRTFNALAHLCAHPCSCTLPLWVLHKDLSLRCPALEVSSIPQGQGRRDDATVRIKSTSAPDEQDKINCFSLFLTDEWKLDGWRSLLLRSLMSALQQARSQHNLCFNWHHTF